MEFLKNFKRRSFINEVIYVGLNIGLAFAIMLIVRVTGLIWPALILVLLSKWRVFAVRPQFWFANIQANLVSFIVSVSYVVFLYSASLINAESINILALQILLAIADACWLLFLKPKSKRKYIIAQAGVGLFTGITAVFMMSYNWVATPVVLLSWLIAYATAKHVLSNYDNEDRVVLMSLSWGILVAEVCWVAYHWTIAYRLPFVTSLLMPQVSIIVLCMSFLAYKIYDSFYHYQKIRMKDVLLPMIFTLAIILVLIIGFNGVTSVAV